MYCKTINPLFEREQLKLDIDDQNVVLIVGTLGSVYFKFQEIASIIHTCPCKDVF